MLTVTTWDFRGFGGFQLQKLSFVRNSETRRSEIKGQKSPPDGSKSLNMDREMDLMDIWMDILIWSQKGILNIIYETTDTFMKEYAY